MTSEWFQSSFRTALEVKKVSVIDLPKSQYKIIDAVNYITKQQIILIILALIFFVFGETISSVTTEIKLWAVNVVVGGMVEIARIMVQPCVSVACA